MLNNKYPNLLSPVKVGNTIFRNHIFSPPSMPHYHQGPETYPGEAIITHFANRAKGGAAVVTCSGTKIYPRTGVTSHFQQCDLYDPQVQNYISQMADAIHFYGAKASIILDSPTRPGFDVVGGIPSHSVAGDGTVPTINEELPASYLNDIAEEYADQCVIFKQCGFDMVFLHMSYQMFLPGRFLSPLTNKRTDEYGGCLENRAKFPIMIFDRIKEKCGRDFLLEASMSPIEAEGGLTLEESARFIELADGHLDIIHLRNIEIDSSHPTGFEPNPTPFRDLARNFKALVKNTSVFVDTVGGYEDFDVCEEMIANGEADFISMARAFISNPNVVNMAREGHADDIVPCLRCNKCHISSHTDPYLSVCSVNPVLGYEHKISHMAPPPERKKKVAVVGGGPGGMKAALLCYERGHEVTLYEKSGRLGGALNHTDGCSFKWPLRNFKDFLIYQVGKHDIKVLLDTNATREMLEAEGYDEVMLAVGSHPIIPKIPGADGANVISAIDVYGLEDSLTKDVVVIGGGEIGTETGMHLAQKGHRVTVIEMQGELASDATPIHFRTMFEEAWKSEPNFSYILNAVCTGITEDGVKYKNAEGSELALSAGSVVLAAGMVPNTNEAIALYAPSYVTHLIGDCNKVGNIQKVMRSALGAASQI